MLEAKNICFGYHNELIKDFSLSLKPGDFTMLLGQNGCGKSTILKLLCGILRPQKGTVSLEEKTLHQWNSKERARKIAMVMQTPPPALDFTAEEMVMMGRHAYLSHLAPPNPRDHAIVDDVMQKLGVAHLCDKPCNTLSGGERQRVMIARALAQQSEILLLDEPTSALDPAHAIEVMNLLRSLPNAPALLLVTHDLQLAARYAKRVMLLKSGRVYADGPAAEVISPANIAAVYDCRASLLPTGRDYNMVILD